LSQISVVIIAQNEAHRIEPALKSVQWADEIVIIDAFSTDQTAKICQKYTNQIYQYQWQGFAKQRLKSIEHASHPWIFSIDADEVVSDELKDQILQIIQQPETKSGYEVPRKTNYLGRWIEHSGWFPDYQLRLFQKEKVYLEPRLVHEGFSVNGEKAKLTGVLFHYSIDSISQHVEKINNYTTLDSQQKLETLSGKRIRWYNLIFNPLSKFLRMYFSNKGYKDGFPGLILALLSAFATQLLYAKVWESQNSE